jgi:hypothetical protein
MPQQPVTEYCFAGSTLMHIAEILAIFLDIVDLDKEYSPRRQIVRKH